MASIVGTTGNDTLTGTDGPDTVDGVTGTDFLYGNAGDDTFVFSGVMTSFPAPPVGLIDGGAGYDVVDVHNVSPARISSGKLVVGNQQFALSNIEKIILNDQNQFISLEQTLYKIVSGTGKDSITVAGNVDVSSGAGDDFFFISPYIIDPSKGSEHTNGVLDASDGHDLLRTNILAHVDLQAGTASTWNANYQIIGFEDVEITAYGSDTYAGGNDSDNKISVWSTWNGPVRIDGRGGNDTLLGGDGGDTIDGGAGDDRIVGGVGADHIFGDSGNDIIEARADGDVIDGGAGRDTVNYDGLAHMFSTSHSGGGASIGFNSSADIITSVEEINFRDATLTFDENSNAAFVMRIYDSTLDRQADAQGLDYWLDQMDAGVSKTDVANAFLQSPEFAQAAGNLSNSDFVEFLYTETLGRSSDPGGKAYWVGLLDGGFSRSDALLTFSESTEHRVQTADTLADGLWVTDDNYQAIAALYDAFNDRLPDENGLGYWVGQLQSGISLSAVASSFAASPEFSQATTGFSNGELVDFMYENTLDRAADDSGKDYWTAQLDAGLSKSDLLLGFSESSEHYGLIGSQIFSGVDYFLV